MQPIDTKGLWRINQEILSASSVSSDKPATRLDAGVYCSSERYRFSSRRVEDRSWAHNEQKHATKEEARKSFRQKNGTLYPRRFLRNRILSSALRLESFGISMINRHAPIPHRELSLLSGFVIRFSFLERP
jgi:hypothetical protein